MEARFVLNERQCCILSDHESFEDFEMHVVARHRCIK